MLLLSPVFIYRGGRDHFCRALYVAIQIGLYHLQLCVESGVQSLRILKPLQALIRIVRDPSLSC